MKRTIASLLALLLAFSMLAGCGGTEKPADSAPAESAASQSPAETQSAAPETAAPTATEQPPAESSAAPTPDTQSIFPLDETLTLTCWDTWPPFFATFDGSFQTPADTYRFKEMEKRLNVKLELTIASTETAKEQFNLMVVGGDYCDLIYAVKDNYTGGIDQAVKDEVIVDLMPYLKAGKIPYYEAAIALDDSLQYDLLSQEGALGGWASIYMNGQKRKTGGLIRGDWLEDLGMEVPKTIDQLHDVLLAFRDQKGATAALWTCDASNGEVAEVKTAFEPIGLYIDDSGKIQYGTDTLKYYYTYMNTLWNEGLLPVDFLSYVESHKPLNSLVDNGLCGVMEDDYDNYMIAYQKVNKDPNCKFVAMPDLVKDENDTIEYYVKNISYEGTEFCALSTACDESLIDTVLAFMDYSYTEEGSLLANYGVEGITFNYNENGKPMFTDLIVNNPNGVPVALANMIYLTGCFPYLRDGEKLEYALSDEERACPEVWNSQQAEVSKGMPNGVSMTADEKYEYDSLFTDLNTFMEESYLNFLTGAKSLDDFDAWLGELNDSFGKNIARMCELQQAAYDRYLERVAAANA